MNNAPQLSTVRILCQSSQLSLVEEAFTEEAAALSILEPDDKGSVTIEALYEGTPDATALHAKLALLANVTGGPALTFEIIPVGNLDWIKKVCENFEPLPIARWTIFGAAFRASIPDDTLGLQIDATSAFGTGEHPTTRGCLIMLDKLLKKHAHAKNWTMLDMGCGSGILAMAFAKATQGRALGIDMDEQSVAIARHNLESNGLESCVRIETGLGYANPLIAQTGPYDLIMANVFARPLCEMAKDLKTSLRCGGHAILSGILNKQANAVVSAHRQQGLRLLHTMRLGEWSVLALHRPFRQSCKV